MIVYVAYADDEIGLPVAEADTCFGLARKLGISLTTVVDLLNGSTSVNKHNKIGVPLTIHRVEIDDDDEGGA